MTNNLVFGQNSGKIERDYRDLELLQRLALAGSTVSIDAMGTQTNIAETIIDSGGDYTLALKGNQPTMHEQTKDFFETAPTKNFRAVEVEQMPEIDGTHGRIETRDYCIASVPE